MTRILQELMRPHARDDFELVRAGREGTYWQAADGLIVRLAAPEADGGGGHDAEAAQRELGERGAGYPAPWPSPQCRGEGALTTNR